jgi:site-specific DNA-methyltransferase (adenine-specific)
VHNINLYLNDCSKVLKTLESNSIDSLITDPPAGIGFMGKEWDSNKGGRDQWIAWMTGVMKECHRVLKPGAHGLVWALPRTAHWTATALEDAGFEVRDVIHHIFGQGFPKSLNIEKAGGGAKWKGWGTALKPAVENWILIRKPIEEKTVTQNVLTHGCGGINIDGGRIDSIPRTPGYKNPGTKYEKKSEWNKRYSGVRREVDQYTGRFPANLVFSHEPECQDNQCSPECAVKTLNDQSPNASRFFYCAKISPSERGKDNNHPTVKPLKLMRYFCKLITPPKGTVLDPFMGSGSTGVAALSEGFRFTGIESEAEYFEIAEKRIKSDSSRNSTHSLGD